METQVIVNQLASQGFVVINNVFNKTEIDTIIEKIPTIETANPAFRSTTDLFAIRQFLKEVPDVKPLVFNQQLRFVIQQIFGNDYFAVKSIYFDKPAHSNWFVAYHQDLTISVDEKLATSGFNKWTIKNNQYSVQPPLDILETNFTIRIHLDDTDKNNGALKVIQGSHKKGIYRPETIDWKTETETTCNVEKGSIMIMKPLLLHASSKTTSQQKRRVIHIEFSNAQLPGRLQWAEKETFNFI